MKPKLIVPIIVATSTALSLVRVLVLFSESWAAVRSERAGDEALLQVCDQQTLATSDKFRNACLAARADSASPVLFKTLMRSVHTAFIDFCEAFNTPTRICLLLLFLLSGVSAPIVKVIVATLIRGSTLNDAYSCSSTAEQENNARLIFIPQDFSKTPKSSWKSLTHRVRAHSSPTVQYNFEDMEEEESQQQQQLIDENSTRRSTWSPLRITKRSSDYTHSKHL
jgi:hypothetical protein